MESNWRLTIAVEGMSYSEITLFARYVGFPDTFLAQRIHNGVRQTSIWQKTLPGDIPHRETVWVPQILSFPSGEPVEPD